MFSLVAVLALAAENAGTGVPGNVPVLPNGDQARRWAAEELSKSVYQDAKPGLLQRALGAVMEWLESVLKSLNGINPNLGLIILVLAIALVIGVAIWLVRPRLNRRNTPAGEVFDVASARSAREYRELAAQAAAQLRWVAAVTEQFRAIVRAAEERAAIDPQLGRTAAEVAVALGAVFIARRRDLDAAASLFNSVHYGGAPAGKSDYTRLQRLDAELQHSTPAYREEGESVPDALVRPR